jgi:hypothetical protein
MPIRPEQAKTTLQLVRDGYKPENMRPMRVAETDQWPPAYINDGPDLDRALKNMGLKVQRNRVSVPARLAGIFAAALVFVGILAIVYGAADLALYELARFAPGGAR